MATYLSINEWADRKGYDSFAAYAADSNPEPSEDKLTSYLKKATRILNNRKHLNTSNVNITNETYLDDIKDYCLDITNRMMDVDRNRNRQGAFYTFSPQDFLYTYERQDIFDISKELGNRVVGLVR